MTEEGLRESESCLCLALSGVLVLALCLLDQEPKGGV
jgi:hypothetical protein